MIIKKLVVFCILLAVAAGGSLAQEETGIRVMSFNIRYGWADDGEDSWEHRHGLVAQTIKDFGPDLLGTQEALLFQVEFLRETLPGYGFVGVGRDDGAESGEMCAIFYREDLFEMLDSGHFWLSKHPEKVASRDWDASLTRMASWVKLRTLGPESVTFIFANTHFDHIGPISRLESARVIQSQLSHIAGTLPVILTGDFNAPANPQAEGPYQVLTVEHGWVDSFRALSPAGGGEGTFNSFRGETTGPRIDWILTTSPLEILAADIVRTDQDGCFPSDHFPVTAMVRFNP